MVTYHFIIAVILTAYFFCRMYIAEYMPHRNKSFISRMTVSESRHFAKPPPRYVPYEGQSVSHRNRQRIKTKRTRNCNKKNVFLRFEF